MIAPISGAQKPITWWQKGLKVAAWPASTSLMTGLKAIAKPTALSTTALGTALRFQENLAHIPIVHYATDFLASNPISDMAMPLGAIATANLSLAWGAAAAGIIWGIYSFADYFAARLQDSLFVDGRVEKFVTAIESAKSNDDWQAVFDNSFKLLEIKEPQTNKWHERLLEKIFMFVFRPRRHSAAFALASFYKLKAEEVIKVIYDQSKKDANCVESIFSRFQSLFRKYQIEDYKTAINGSKFAEALEIARQIRKYARPDTLHEDTKRIAAALTKLDKEVISKGTTHRKGV